MSSIRRTLISMTKKLPKGFKEHRKYEALSILEMGYSDEITCPHGVGHEQGIHGCDGCCEKLRKYWGLDEDSSIK
jgi:hypothetical protein